MTKCQRGACVDEFNTTALSDRHKRSIGELLGEAQLSTQELATQEQPPPYLASDTPDRDLHSRAPINQHLTDPRTPHAKRSKFQSESRWRNRVKHSHLAFAGRGLDPEAIIRGLVSSVAPP